MLKFKIDITTRKIVILLLFVGLLFNILSFFHFRYSSVRRIDDAVAALTVSAARLYDDVLLRIEDRLSTVSTNTFDFPLVSSPATKNDDSPLLPVIDSINYDYFVADGRHIARILHQDFSVGSPYPRGGVITRVYADCLIIDNKYRVSNGSSGVSRRSLASVETSQPDFDFNSAREKLKGSKL